jgi:hypothetical protein
MFKVCIIPGAQRCGSTYLSNLLSNIDGVRKPILGGVEPKWFLNEKNFKLSFNEYVNEVFGELESNSKEILLDKSTSYFYSEEVPSEIFKKLGEIRIVLILRNPIERALSHFNFSKTHGYEKHIFKDAIRLDPENRDYDSAKISMNPYNYVKNGLYDTYLRNWIKFFPNIKVVFLEDLSIDSEVLCGICDYLEIECTSNSALWNSKRVNNSVIGESYIDKDDISYLSSVFKDSNSNLSEMLGRDLPFKW